MITVFLSYNHDDEKEAIRLETALVAKNIHVHIDRDQNKAGEQIESFIRRSIRVTDATICLISKRSLLSSWVATETITAFYAEALAEKRRFIACYLDDDFLRDEYLLELTTDIDQRILELNEIISGYAERNLDSADLNAKKTRLHKLRASLGDILLRLRDSFSLDVRGSQLSPSVERIVETLEDDAAARSNSPVVIPVFRRCGAVVIGGAVLAGLSVLHSIRLTNGDSVNSLHTAMAFLSFASGFVHRAFSEVSLLRHFLASTILFVLVGFIVGLSPNMIGKPASNLTGSTIRFVIGTLIGGYLVASLIWRLK